MSNHPFTEADLRLYGEAEARIDGGNGTLEDREMVDALDEMTYSQNMHLVQRLDGSWTVEQGQ